MNRIMITLFLFVLCFGLYAQWSTNAAAPNQICSLTQAQVVPKTAITSGGITYIAWMDNTSGNYNTYLQKLNLLGVAEWTTPLLISNNTADTWLTDWDMDCDINGNAVLVFQDIRLGTNNVVVYKISQTGAFLWGNNGIMLSGDTSTDVMNMAPTLLCLVDGRTIVAWQRSVTTTSVILQSLSDTGELQWGTTGLALSPDVGSYTWPQLLASDTCCLLLKYYEETGPYWSPNRKILVQKFNSLGQPLWPSPTVVQNLGGISIGTQLLSITSDGLGGMIIAWPDDRNSEFVTSTYVQRILVNGSVDMPINGARVSMETGYNQFYPKVAYEPDQQKIYVVWSRTNLSQSMRGLQAQKLSLSGDRLWNLEGVTIIPVSNYPTYPIAALNMESGVVFLYSVSPFEDSDLFANLKAYCINQEGLPVWDDGFGYIATTLTTKLHYDTDLFSSLWGVITWEDGSDDSYVNAMRLNYSGILGTVVPSPYNLAIQMFEENVLLLTWEFPEGVDLPIGFKVYRNGVYYHLVAGSEATQDVFDNLGPGLWSFYVTALYESGEESPPSNQVTVNITGNYNEQINPAVFSLSAYPNPFKNHAIIAVKGLETDSKTLISIYNIKGQMVRRINFSGKTEINWMWDGNDNQQVSTTPGIYFIKIRSGSNQRTIKLLKH